jgi:hypothetical protein
MCQEKNAEQIENEPKVLEDGGQADAWNINDLQVFLLHFTESIRSA